MGLLTSRSVNVQSVAILVSLYGELLKDLLKRFRTMRPSSGYARLKCFSVHMQQALLSKMSLWVVSL